MKIAIIILLMIPMFYSCAEVFRKLTIIEYTRTEHIINNSKDTVILNFSDTVSSGYSTASLYDMYFTPESLTVLPNTIASIEMKVDNWYEEGSAPIDSFNSDNDRSRQIVLKLHSVAQDTILLLPWKTAGQIVSNMPKPENSTADYKSISLSDTFEIP